MGCDIHSFVEVKTESDYDGDTWVAVVDPDDPESECLESWATPDRDYWLFTILAGVRNNLNPDIVPICEPNSVGNTIASLPVDVSDEVWAAFKRWRWDYHTIGYFTLEQLLDYPDWDMMFKVKFDSDENASVTPRELAGCFLTETMPKLKKLGAVKDVRVVFWFDN